MKRQEPRLMHTKDYSMFEVHEYNRDIGKTKVLEQSMREHGFDPGFPIRCTNGGGGKKLKINQGHHRFHVARKLGLPVWFVISNNDLSIFEVERGNRQWNIKDFLEARVRAGEDGPVKIKKFIASTGIPCGQAIALVGGEDAASHNQTCKLIRGDFKAKPNKHADDMAVMVNYLRDLGVPFATNCNFVNALSKCMLSSCFNQEIFRRKSRTHITMFEKCRNLEDYLYLIENIYNQQTPLTKKVPIAFEAKRESNLRNVCNGKKAD